MVREVPKLALDTYMQLRRPFYLSPSKVEGYIQSAFASGPLNSAPKKDISVVVGRAKSRSQSDVAVIVRLAQIGSDGDCCLKDDLACSHDYLRSL